MEEKKRKGQETVSFKREVECTSVNYEGYYCNKVFKLYYMSH